jgi:hypothetical protein
MEAECSKLTLSCTTEGKEFKLIGFIYEVRNQLENSKSKKSKAIPVTGREGP